MEVIKEDYCSFELSKLLKEKGFEQEGCHKSYSMEGPVAPTHQMAMKWLREKHDIIIVIEPHSYNHMEEKTSSYDFSIWYGDNYEHPLTTNYSTYEEAVEAAILYVLSEVL